MRDTHTHSSSRAPPCSGAPCPHNLGAAAHASRLGPCARLLVRIVDQLRVRPLDDDGNGGQQMKTKRTRHVFARTGAGMLAEQVDEGHCLRPKAAVGLKDERREAVAEQLDQEGVVAFLARLAVLRSVEGVAGGLLHV